MSRPQRIRIVIGICMFLAGLTVTAIGPTVAVWLYSQQLSSMSDSGDNFGQSIAVMERASRLSLGISCSGVALAAAGFLTTFIQWACWFIGPRDSEAA